MAQEFLSMQQEADVQVELARWPQKLVLIDVNNTITDPENGDSIPSSHAQALKESAQNARRNGWVIMTNSDSPGKPLSAWAEQKLGFSKSTVHENGCVLYNADTQHAIIRATIPNVQQLKQGIDEHLQGQAVNGKRILRLSEEIWSPEWSNIGYKNIFQVADKNGKRPAQPGDIVYGYGAGRVATAAIFAGEMIVERGELTLTPTKGIAEPLTEQLDLTLSLLQQQGRFPAGCCSYSYPTDGFVALHPGENKGDVKYNKARAIALLSNGFPSRTIIAIGDDFRDGVPPSSMLNERHGPIHATAVGNASPDLKEQAEYVAKAPLALGVKEILDRYCK